MLQPPGFWGLSGGGGLKKTHAYKRRERTHWLSGQLQTSNRVKWPLRKPIDDLAASTIPPPSLEFDKKFKNPPPLAGSLRQWFSLTSFPTSRRIRESQSQIQSPRSPLVRLATPIFLPRRPLPLSVLKNPPPNPPVPILTAARHPPQLPPLASVLPRLATPAISTLIP